MVLRSCPLRLRAVLRRRAGDAVVWPPDSWKKLPGLPGGIPPSAHCILGPFEKRWHLEIRRQIETSRVSHDRQDDVLVRLAAGIPPARSAGPLAGSGGHLFFPGQCFRIVALPRREVARRRPGGNR